MKHSQKVARKGFLYIFFVSLKMFMMNGHFVSWLARFSHLLLRRDGAADVI